MAFLPGINATQSNFATNLAGLQIDQENKNRAVRLMFIQQFMERLIRERELKKQQARQQTASQQSSAINAGAILAAPFTGGLSLGAMQKPQTLAGATQGFQGGGTGIDDFLNLLGSQQ